MRFRIGVFIGLGVALISTVVEILDAVHFFDLIDEHMPGWIKPMITPEHNLILFAVGWILAAIAWAEHKHSSTKSGHDSTEIKNPVPPPSPNIVTNTANATGNQIVQNFTLPSYPLGDLAKAIADQLKTGDKTGISAKDEAEAALPPPISATDGFVQFENVELQVESPVLDVGKSVTAKYYYANRGTLPVHEVQTWGLMQVLDPTLNSGPHLKAVMIEAAKDGHRKFPGAATLGVQHTKFALAPLSEPFTQEQIDGLKSKSKGLFLIVGGVWVDNQREPHYWAVCHQAEITDGLDLRSFNWRNL